MKLLRVFAVVAVVAAVAIGYFLHANNLFIAAAPNDLTLTMSAVAYEEHGPSSNLKFRTDYPRPQPLAHQVLVKIMAASINPCDFKFRRNTALNWMNLLPIAPKPKIGGDDIAGVVVALGSDVAAKGDFKIGERVAAMIPIIGQKWGAYAQYVAVDRDHLARIPESVSFEQAAAVPLVALTVLQAFDNLGNNTQGKSILIHAASGGVGSFAVQWAHNVLGMKVTATCSSKNAKLVKRLGASTVIDYRKTAFETEVKDLDVVLDMMSYAYEARTLNSNASVLKSPEGHYLNILGSDWEFSEGEKGNGALTYWNAVVFKILHKFGLRPDYDMITVTPNGRQLQQVMDAMSAGRLHAVIDRVMPLEKTAEAQDYVATGRAVGKVVLKISHNE